MTTKALIVVASAKEHEQVKAVVDQADKKGGGDLVTKTYTLQRANPTTITTALTPVVPNAVVSSDPTNKMLIVTASVEDHTQIKSIVDEADRRDQGELTTVVYSVKWANPTAISYALKPIVPDAIISPDITNKSLIVTASAKEHEQVKMVVDQADRRGTGELTTKAYALKWANPSTISVALQSVVPDAKMSSDTANKMLVVTASQEDHDRIQAVLDQADQRGGGGQLVTKAYTLQLANPSTIVAALTPVVPNATVSSDPTNKMLIVTASEEDHKTIQAIVDEADRRGEGELTTVVYSLKWVSPTASPYALRPVVPNAIISPDVTTKTLIVVASAKEHEQVKAVVDQADKKGGGDLVTKTYTLQRANPSTITTALTPVVPNAVISSDPINRMLIVTASAEDHTQIKSIVDEADRRDQGELTTVVYSLKWANPTAISYALKPIVPDAIISPDITNKSLIVTASAKEHEQVKLVVEQSDRRGTGEMTTKAYAPKWANPTTIARALQTVVPNATVSSDTANKMLVVTASQEDHDRIQAVLSQADQRGGGGELVTRPYALQLANPTTIATALAPVVPNATISSDVTNKMLVVTASEDDHKTIQAIVDEADRRGEGELTTVVYSLKWANSTAIAAALRPVAPNATVSPDVYNKTLIVTASAKDHTLIKAVVDQADKQGGGEMTTKAYTLKWANGTAVAGALASVVPDAKISSDLYNRMLIVTATEDDHGRDPVSAGSGRQAGRRRPDRPGLLAQIREPRVDHDGPRADDARRNDRRRHHQQNARGDRVAGGPRAHQGRGRSGGPAGRGRNGDEVFLLNTANPLSVQRALEPLVPNAIIGADATSKTLIVTAPAEDQARIKDIVEQADRRGQGELSMRVYPFKLADPVAVATALRSLVPGATMSPDASTNTLIITAGEQDHLQIEPLVKQLDVADPQARVVKAYQVKNGEPADVYQSLSLLYRYGRDVSIGYQETTGTILVAAPPAEHEEIQQAIADIEKVTAGSVKATLQVYSLQGMDGTAAASTLRPAGRQGPEGRAAVRRAQRSGARRRRPGATRDDPRGAGTAPAGSPRNGGVLPAIGRSAGGAVRHQFAVRRFAAGVVSASGRRPQHATAVCARQPQTARGDPAAAAKNGRGTGPAIARLECTNARHPAVGRRGRAVESDPDPLAATARQPHRSDPTTGRRATAGRRATGDRR